MTPKEQRERDAMRSQLKMQARELRRAGREILRLLKFKARKGALPKRDIMLAFGWAMTFATKGARR